MDTDKTKPIDLLHPPEDLRRLKNWVVWKREMRADAKPGEKPTKVPYCARNGRKADASDPETWGTFEEVVPALRSGKYTGVGFEFNFPYCGIDLDECRDPETGVIEEWALAVVRTFDSYTEISPSGTGLHIFIQAGLPGPGINKRDVNGHKIEMYDNGRFFTFTGQHLEGTPKVVNPRQKEAVEFYKWVIDEAAKTKAKKSAAKNNASKPAAPKQEPQQFAPTDLSDEEVVTLALNAKNGAKFERLFCGGDISGYASNSEADSALTSLLCFWTNNDTQVERLLKESKLYRAKHERADYLADTISNARKIQTERYSKEYGGKANAQKRQQIAATEGFIQVVLRSSCLWDITAEGRLDLLAVIALANGRKVFPISSQVYAEHLRTKGLETEDERKVDDRVYAWRHLKALREELAAKVDYPIFTRIKKGKFSPTVKEASVYSLDLLPFFQMLEAADADPRSQVESENFRPLNARADAAVAIGWKYKKTPLPTAPPPKTEKGSFAKWQAYRDAILKKAEKGATELAESCRDTAGIDQARVIIDDCNQLVTRIAETFSRKIPSNVRRKLLIEKTVIKPMKEAPVTSPKPTFFRKTEPAADVQNLHLPDADHLTPATLADGFGEIAEDRERFEL